MLEVLFGESEAGSIKSTGKEVACLGFMLDIGDITVTVDSEYRKNLIYEMLYQDQWEHRPEVLEELKETGNVYVKELEKLKVHLDKGGEIRIWYSDSPYARCGMCFLCYWMKKYENAVYAVKLPEYRRKGNAVISYQNWGEVLPEELEWFLQFQKKLSLIERLVYAHCWSELIEENSPLRAIINGQLVSVEEDFYDFLIWKRLTRKPVKEARLIGDILGIYPIGIYDWWYGKRIDEFIEEGRIKVVEDCERKYGRTIQLNEMEVGE